MLTNRTYVCIIIVINSERNVFMNVYKNCPILESENFLLRFVDIGDADDLLLVYSDLKSVSLFNSDNCGGDDFYYTTIERMKEAIEYWIWEYSRKGFVRWSIIDKNNKQIIGTVELFKRKAKDYFNDCAVLRLDLRSDYEKCNIIAELLCLIISDTFKIFKCKMIATKAFPQSDERLTALKRVGFKLSDEILIGTHDRESYSNYAVAFK